MKTGVLCYFAILMSVLLSCCNSAQKLHNSGEHDKVIEVLYSKAKRGSLKQDELAIFQLALNVKLDKERERLENRIGSSYYAAWRRGFVRLDYVGDLQNQLSTFEQLNYDSIRLINVESWDKQFADSLGQHHFDEFNANQDHYFQTGNKNALIKAYDELEKLAFFDTRGVNVDSTMSLFSKVGKRNIDIVFRHTSRFSI